MNKKIFIPVITVIVLATVGYISWDFTYDPFLETQYADSVSTQTAQNIQSIKDDGYTVFSAGGASHDGKSFNETIRTSDLIISGSIKKVEFIEERDNPVSGSFDYYTLYTVIIHDYMKGSVDGHEIKYSIYGGLFDGIWLKYDHFVFSERDQVLLLLIKYQTEDGETIYTPNGLFGHFKVTNGGPNSGQVHKYGENATVSLPEFKSTIQSMVLV